MDFLLKPKNQKPKPTRVFVDHHSIFKHIFRLDRHQYRLLLLILKWNMSQSTQSLECSVDTVIDVEMEYSNGKWSWWYMRCTILNYFVVLSIEFAKIKGRKASEAWHTAFGISKDISILKRENHGHCIHCSSLVKHHGKSELVVSHL